jgi:formate dehydrogenase iron-sulfur subunit
MAKSRADQLKTRGFDKAEVYGEDELGGLHVIMVAHRGIEAHGLKTDPAISETVYAWQVMKPLGGVAAAAVFGGLLVSFLTGVGYEREPAATGASTSSEEVE